MAQTHHYESAEAHAAHERLRELSAKFEHGEVTPRELATARRQWHKLRDRDLATERIVRDAIMPRTVVVVADTASQEVRGVYLTEADLPDGVSKATHSVQTFEVEGTVAEG